MALTISVLNGEYLYKQGDVATDMYVIKSGSLQITTFKVPQQEIFGPTFFAGAVVGELSLFDGKRRGHNLKATQDTEVEIMPYDSLADSIESLPVWARALIKVLINRLRRYIKREKFRKNL